MDMSILEAQSDVLFGNVAGWEQSTLNRIAKRINAVGKMSVADVKALNNVAFVKQDMKEITKDLAKMTKMNVSQIEKIYGDTLAQQHLENSPLYDYRNKNFVPFADNKELQAIVRAYSKTTAGNMVNLSKIGANNLGVLDVNGKFKPLERFYTDALDKAVMQVASGSTDFHTAMRDVIQTMGGSGIRVSYPGTDITRRLDTAVRQSLLWGAKQASIEYNEMIGEELGCDGIEVDWHSFPRPSHEFMQGKQFVIGKAQKINGVMFESADDALRALNDYGCLHYKTPIICGISESRFSEQELADLNKRNAQIFDIDGKQMTGYEASQAMRRLETGVREQKTTREAARNAGDKVLADRCTAKIKAYQAKYNEISEKTGIAPSPKRMSIPKGLNSVKSVDFSGNGGIMKLSAEHGEINSSQGTKEDVGAVQREAERIKNKLGISRVNLNGLKNADVLEAFIDETERLQNQYGKKYSGIVVSQNLSGTRIICEVNPSLQLCINADYFNDKQHLEKTLAAMLKNKYIPEGCQNIEYISKHEYWHMYTKQDIDNPKSKVRVMFSRMKKSTKSKFISINSATDPYEFAADYLSAPISTKDKMELVKYFNLEEK